MYGGADPLAVDRVRRVIRSQSVESAVWRRGQRCWKRPRRRFPVRMISGAQRAERGCRVRTAARTVQSRRRREQRMRMRIGEQSGRGGRVIAAGQAGVATKVLKKLLGRGEPFSAVRVAGDPVADVRPATGQRGRVRERRRSHGAERRQRHRQTVLLMIALRAPARAGPGAHHQLRAVHAVLATGAVRIFANWHQSLATGWRLHASVAQIRVPTCRGARRITEKSRRRGVMMRERRGAGERRSERWILG